MVKQNSYRDLRIKHSDYIIIRKAGCFYDVRDFGAVLLADRLGYKLYSDNVSENKTGIPVSQIDKAPEDVKKQ